MGCCTFVCALARVCEHCRLPFYASQSPLCPSPCQGGKQRSPSREKRPMRRLPFVRDSSSLCRLISGCACADSDTHVTRPQTRSRPLRRAAFFIWACGARAEHGATITCAPLPWCYSLCRLSLLGGFVSKPLPPRKKKTRTRARRRPPSSSSRQRDSGHSAAHRPGGRGQRGTLAHTHLAPSLNSTSLQSFLLLSTRCSRLWLTLASFA